MAKLKIKDSMNDVAYRKIMQGYEEGKAAGLTIAKNEDQSDRVTPAQLKLIQEKQGVQSPYQPKEAVDPLDPSKGVVDKASIDGINTIMLPFNLKDRETDDHYGTPSGTPEEVDELLRRGWAHGPWEDDSSNWADFSGGVQLPDGSWIYPTKDGKYFPESDEIKIKRLKYLDHREQYDRYEPHPEFQISHNYRPGPATQPGDDLLIRANQAKQAGDIPGHLKLLNEATQLKRVR